MGSECSTRIAIIVAGGSGNRFGAKKQFIEVNGKPLYCYSIEAFKGIADRIILVVPEEDIDTVEPYGAELAAGGSERYESVYNALRLCANDGKKSCPGGAQKCSAEKTLIAIHDAARPAVSKEIIEQCYRDAEEYGAAVPVIPVTDTIRTVEGELIDRSTLRAMQTPQTFKGELILPAYEKLMALPQEARKAMHITDDVQVVDVMMGHKTHYSKGSVRNAKVTTTEDIAKITMS